MHVVLCADALLAMSKVFFFFEKKNAINQRNCRSHILGGTSRLVEVKCQLIFRSIPPTFQYWASYLSVPDARKEWADFPGLRFPN